MKTLLFETEIHCPQQTLFDFHADPKNLVRIMPPGITVCIGQMPAVITSGSAAVLFIRRGGLGFRWKLRFERFDPPLCIVDAALESPFHLFRHEHRFLALERGRSLLRDEVRFALPFGWFGTLVEPLVVWDMKRMFAYRHAQTKAVLEGELS